MPYLIFKIQTVSENKNTLFICLFKTNHLYFGKMDDSKRTLLTPSRDDVHL